MRNDTEFQRDYDYHLSTLIGVYDNVVDKNLCKEVIDYFEDSRTFRTNDHRKSCTEMQLIGDYRSKAERYRELLWEKIAPYGTKYELMLHYSCHPDFKPADIPLATKYRNCIRSLQIQKYTPEDKGYPAVHTETGPEFKNRFLAVIVYLNTVEEGGETVFPLAGSCITPEVGRLVIFPTAIPFYHCGMKSSTDKYILTTWFEFE
jgi:hypothetical protein